MPTIVMVYDEVPPSANKGVGSRAPSGQITGLKARWEGIFATILLAHRVPRRMERAEVSARLQFKNKRTRDADNFHFAISKPLGDAMTKGGWLQDDDSTRFKFTGVEIDTEPWTPPTKLIKSRMTLTITYEMP